MVISETDFFDTLTIQNDQISYVKHVLAPLMRFSPYLGGGGGAPKGSRAQPAYAVFPPQQLKMVISETDFFDTLAIQNDQISYVKDVLAPRYVFFTLFGFSGGRGGSQGF